MVDDMTVFLFWSRRTDSQMLSTRNRGRLSVLVATLLFLITGCSVGGHYGYGTGVALAPSSIGSGDPTEFERTARSFLRSELRRECARGDPDIRGFANGYSVEFKVRGLRGCIITGGRLWELIQITFTRFGNDSSRISVIVDGWTAPGFLYPADSQFTRSMEPEYAGSVSDFARMLASDFALFEQK